MDSLFLNRACSSAGSAWILKSIRSEMVLEVCRAYEYRVMLAQDNEVPTAFHLLLVKEDETVFTYTTGPYLAIWNRAYRIKQDVLRKAALTWRFNEMGHVELWRRKVNPAACEPDSADVYLQVDTDVQSFFSQFGKKMDDLLQGDWDHETWDPGYFTEEKCIQFQSKEEVSSI